MAAIDLTTLANVKEYIGVTSGNDDKLLTRMITALSAYVQSWLSRNFALQAYVETFNGLDNTRMILNNYPIVSVASVMINGVAVPAASLPALSGWTGYVWTSTQLALQGYTFSRGYSNVIVSYTAGFSVTPPDIEQAVIEVIALRYKERDRIGFVSKSIGGETVTFSLKDLPASVQTLLLQYRRMVTM